MRKILSLISAVFLIAVPALCIVQWVVPTGVSAATPISFGEVVSASIATVGETDDYTFAASADDVVLIRLEDTDGDGFYARIRLYAPDSSLVATQFSTSSFEMQ
jgi:hypothetical protein